MKQKRNVHGGILIAGVLCVIGAWFVQEEYYSTMLFSCGVAWIVSGGIQLKQDFYYAKPEHQAEYEERQMEKRINLKDERKITLRRMAGYRCYQIMYFVLLAVSLLFALLRVEWWMTGTIFLLWFVQYIMGVVFFRYYEKRL